MIDEEWLGELSFETLSGVRITGLAGYGNEKIQLKGILPDGTQVVVGTYKHHLGYHIREIPPFLSGRPLYNVETVNRKLCGLMGCGFVDAICSDYDRVYASIVKWLHTKLNQNVHEVSAVIRSMGAIITPACPEALHFILASSGMKRRFEEIASLPDGKDIRLMLPRVNLPNFPIDGYREELVAWGRRMLEVSASLAEDAPLEPEGLEQNILYVWGAAALDGFFTDAELPLVKQILEEQFGTLMAHPKRDIWVGQIDAVAHLMACFLEKSQVYVLHSSARHLVSCFRSTTAS